MGERKGKIKREVDSEGEEEKATKRGEIGRQEEKSNGEESKKEVMREKRPPIMSFAQFNQEHSNNS